MDVIISVDDQLEDDALSRPHSRVADALTLTVAGAHEDSYSTPLCPQATLSSFVSLLRAYQSARRPYLAVFPPCDSIDKFLPTPSRLRR